MKKTIRILALILVICLAAGIGAFAADSYTKNLVANYVGVKLVVDGVTITPKDAKGNVVDPFIVDGTTYLPVRAVAEALGKEVDWDGSTKTVYIGKKPQTDVPAGYNALTTDDGTRILYTAAPFNFVNTTYGRNTITQNIERIDLSYLKPWSTGGVEIEYSIVGTVSGKDYLWIGAKFYDNEGILLDDRPFFVRESISQGEKFKYTGTFVASKGTVRIEFYDGYSK